MREAELFDGTVLEFPDDTPDDVIVRVAKEQTAALQRSKDAPDSASMGFGSRAQRENLKEMGAGEAALRGVGQGFMIGFGDEANAAAAASPLPGAGAVNAMRTPVPNALDTIAGGARMLAEKVAPGVFGDSGTKKAEARFAEEKAQNRRAVEDQPGAYIAGNIGGMIINPAGRIGGTGATRGARALSNAKANAAVAGIYGFGEGEGLEDRLVGAGTGMAVGGALGGALGAALPGAASGASRNAVVEASDRLGANIPKAAASDSRVVQMGGSIVTKVPGAGVPLQKATERTIETLGQKADEVAGALGGETAETAGNKAGQGLVNWITGKSKATVKQAYDAVDSVVDDAVRAPLANTAKTVADIAAKRANAQIQGSSKALDEVIGAVQSPQGLNYSGVKDLRTYIGQLQKRAPDGMPEDELKAIYGALTRDLESIVAQAGGARGRSLWQRANKLNAATEKRRQEFAKIIGVKHDAPAAAVYERLVAMATQGGKSNTSLLVKAKKALATDEWDGVASAVVSRLGRSPGAQQGADAFSPERFVTDWAKLSPNAKGLLFGGKKEHLQALEDIATVSTRFKQLNRFANPSGTGQMVVGAGIGTAIYNDPIETAKQLLGAGAISLVLARPATAQSMAHWAKAHQAAASGAKRAVDALNAASRQFAERLARELGITGDGLVEQLAVAGPRLGRASDEEEQNQSDQ